MSSEFTAYAWDKKLPCKEKLALLSISDIADNAGRCQFSMLSIAEKCADLSLEEVKTSLQNLAQKKILVFQPSTRPLREKESWINLMIMRR